ncbi:MAG: glycogen synthase [SAR324 cluster bacterium]|nr:glycogen synthase [SAR324 cluster bacterium]MBL7034622.1 glycogen synthase [SAR324 cluster bacterium]
MSEVLRIIFASAEVDGFSKSGGLADVARALPLHLKQLGHDVRIVTPFYRSIPESHQTETIIHELGVPLGNEEIWCAVRQTELTGSVDGKAVSLPVYLIEHEHYFFRRGYYDDGLHEYPDNASRFAFFSKSVLQLCLALEWIPDIFHANDWHTALLPFYLRQSQQALAEFTKSRSVLTIHNAGYQGNAPVIFRNSLEIAPEYFVAELFEDHGQLNLLKGGIHFADQVNTVSSGYAEEMRTPLGSHGLHQTYLNKGRNFCGILNGCDYDDWNPETDSHLPATYSAADLNGKKACKLELQKIFGLPELTDVPVIGMVSRLTGQKGFDYLLPAMQKILALKLQLVILGSGELWIANSFDELKQEYPQNLGWKNGYDNELAHLIEAGSDMFLMPSLYEPCGLNQMYSLCYGTLPIVRRVGGLKDTVIQFDEAQGPGNGFIFDEPDSSAVFMVVDLAVRTYYQQPQHFGKMINSAMQQRFTWKSAAEKYVDLYYKTLK